MRRVTVRVRYFSEAKMKTTILSAALMLGLRGVAQAAAADEKADPVGTWKSEYAIGDQKRTATLTITQDGDALAGTMSWPEQKDAKLKDVKLKDTGLAFSAERVIGERKNPVEYKFTIEGDTLKGTGAVVSGERKTDFDITGKREKKGT
jgi:hypothetical protein